MPAPEDSRAGYSLADRLKHIEEVSKNARGTWFALIAALLFSAIAIGGVEDRDFFVFDSGLTLPVISYTVPLKPFFAVGSAIILGLYIYLHLYLAKLWRALAGIKPQPDGGLFLDDLVFPWLISDAAVYLKPGGPKRGGRWLTVAVAVLFLWAAGPLVLALFWWRSFPPHDVWLTLWVGLMFGVSLVAAAVSFCGFMKVLRQDDGHEADRFWTFAYGFMLALSVVSNAAIAGYGHRSTVGNAEDGIYSADLYRAGLVERPDNWLPWDEARADFLRARKDERPEDPGKHAEWEQAAGKTFSKRRKTMFDGLAARDFQTWSFRKAKAREVFLPGADLRGTDWRGADLTDAVLESADFRCTDREESGARVCTNLQEAVLWRANLQEAVLRDANLQEAVLEGANLQEADLRRANLQEAKLARANLQEAVLWNANLQEAVLWDANLQEAGLRLANLQEADLRGANLQEAKLDRTNLQEAVLRDANLQEAELRGADLKSADTRRANFAASLLVSADLSVNPFITQAQINSAFGDLTTQLPETCLNDNGEPQPCIRPPHWPAEELEWGEVPKRWRDWLALRSQRPVKWDPANGWRYE